MRNVLPLQIPLVRCASQCLECCLLKILHAIVTQLDIIMMKTLPHVERVSHYVRPVEMLTNILALFVKHLKEYIHQTLMNVSVKMSITIIPH